MAIHDHNPTRRAALAALAGTPLLAGTIGATLAGIEPAEAAQFTHEEKLREAYEKVRLCRADLREAQGTRSEPIRRVVLEWWERELARLQRGRA